MLNRLEARSIVDESPVSFRKTPRFIGSVSGSSRQTVIPRGVSVDAGSACLYSLYVRKGVAIAYKTGILFVLCIPPVRKNLNGCGGSCGWKRGEDDLIVVNVVE